MSYNVDTIEIIESEGFAIPRSLWRELAMGDGVDVTECPEDSFLSPDWPARSCDDVRGILFVKRIAWSGACSGHYWDKFKELLPKFLGRADLVVTWEGGDSFSGVRLLNGKVTFHEVTKALGKEVVA